VNETRSVIEEQEVPQAVSSLVSPPRRHQVDELGNSSLFFTKRVATKRGQNPPTQNIAKYCNFLRPKPGLFYRDTKNCNFAQFEAVPVSQ
jgi:hypothetical protein